MIYKALNRAILFNKAVRIYNKKNGLELTELSLNILYSAIHLQTNDRKVSISSINQFFTSQNIRYSYQHIRQVANTFVSLNIFIPSLTKDHSFVVSSYGVSVLNSFELCLRRVRHDR